MNAHDARALVQFNQWANDRTLADIGTLTHDELTRDLHNSFSSILGTIAHVFWAEWVWLRRWQHESPKQAFNAADYTSIDDVVRRWRDVQGEQLAFIENVTDAELEERIAYQNFANERWEYSLARMIQHLVNHSTYHRGQIVTLLRQLGKPARSTDLLMWIDEGGGS